MTNGIELELSKAKRVYTNNLREPRASRCEGSFSARREFNKYPRPSGGAPMALLELSAAVR